MPPDMDIPATKTGVQALLSAHGVQPRRLRGQHFLVDRNLVQAIVREAAVGPDDCVLEVGTGTGILTEALAERAGCVVSCDLDRTLQDVARSARAWPQRVVFLAADVLAAKRRLNPDVIGRWRAEREARGLASLLVVSNLPYSVATPFLASLLWEGVPARDGVVMVQRDAADRFLAGPGTKEYGPVSVAVGLLADAALLRPVGRKVFWPEPRVESALIRVKPKDPGRARSLAVAGLPALLHEAFLHRRKSLRGRIPAERLAAAGIDPGARPEEISPEDWARLALTVPPVA